MTCQRIGIGTEVSVRFFQHNQHRARSPNARTVSFASERDFEDQVEHNPYSQICRNRRYPTKIEYRHRLFPSKPILHRLDQRIVTVGIALRFLKEP